MKGDTRNRILVASLLLFNEQGEPGTTTNEIADEVDISPGNLHYHFRKKEQVVTALLDEFQADARRVLQPPSGDLVTIDDFWMFLHLLLECTAAYRFLFRDLESLSERYPGVRRVLGHFARGLAAVFEIYLRQLVTSGLLVCSDDDAAIIARNLAVIALFSERFDGLSGLATTADDAALRVAGSILNALKPITAEDAAAHIEDLAAHYNG
ncbi:MAG: TetR/AcrR family transcriptional regulator [Gammaproteobacteria bacterium]|nr:TetR/AcrR family transcriptional regulator [Gammaproteobacteria bacterium]